METHKLLFAIPKPLMVRVNAYARSIGTTYTEVCRRALSEFLDAVYPDNREARQAQGYRLWLDEINRKRQAKAGQRG